MDNLIKNIIREKKIIGRGSFGKIYHSQSYPNYIVKKMNKLHICNIEYICNNIKELWWQIILSKINLNNVSTMKNYYIDCDFIYMLMKHNGTSIYDKIKEITNIKDNTELKKQKHIELLKCIPNILFTCSKILYCLHRCKMRHGDLTSSNILINEKNEVSIIDWGSVIFNKVRTSFYNQCAIIFSPPELKNGEKNLFQNIPSIKNDIFSLGIVILNIIDIHSTYIDKFNKYKSKCEIYDTDCMNDEIETILKSTTKGEKYISEIVNERIFFLLKKMLEYNIETRIDIESLYMDSLFLEFRKRDIFDKNVIYNFFKNTNHICCYPIDEYNNILVISLYNFLKKYKETTQSTQHTKVFDSRIIFDISIKLFYNYKNKSGKIKNHINSYIICFLACIKWTDTILNDDFILKDLYVFYLELFNSLESLFGKKILETISNVENVSYVEPKVNFCDFCVSFDIVFFDIFKTMEEYIFSYPDILDLNYSKISFRELKNKMLIN